MLPSSLVAHAVIEAVLARSVSGRPRLIGDFFSFDVQVPARARVFVGERRSWNNDRLPGFREEMQQSGLLSCSVQSTATSTAVHRRPPPPTAVRAFVFPPEYLAVATNKIRWMSIG
jgi:hypothetical protein